MTLKFVGKYCTRVVIYNKNIMAPMAIESPVNPIKLEAAAAEMKEEELLGFIDLAVKANYDSL